jgi:hypothetical protein
MRVAGRTSRCIASRYDESMTPEDSVDEPGISPHDFRLLSTYIISILADAADADWSARAGSLEWSCFHTADHVIDCVFSYALFLGSGKEDDYPKFCELRALPGASARDLIDGLRAVTTMLWALTVSVPSDTRAIIRRSPQPQTGRPREFAARGALELILHAYDISEGLRLAFAPDLGAVQRLFNATHDWPGQHPFESCNNVWFDLIARSGRPPR